MRDQHYYLNKIRTLVNSLVDEGDPNVDRYYEDLSYYIEALSELRADRKLKYLREYFEEAKRKLRAAKIEFKYMNA